jgi:hypothetical protein
MISVHEMLSKAQEEMTQEFEKRLATQVHNITQNISEVNASIQKKIEPLMPILGMKPSEFKTAMTLQEQLIEFITENCVTPCI